MFNKQIKILPLLLLSFTHLFGQTKQVALKKYFSALAEAGQFNGNVLVAENGAIIYEQSFGYADFEKKIANTNNTAFVIASLSKTLTATAILQLSQSGKLKISDPVKKYLPWFPYEKITIKHLLSHTSGIPPYNAFFDSIRKQQPERVFTNADFMDGVVSNPKPLLYQPGDKGRYDNVNFIVLALLIEKVSGMMHPDYITRYVLRPANMTNTHFLSMRSQYSDSNKVPLAYAYLYPHRYSDSLVKATQVPYIVNYWSAYNFSGFGDYVSTVHDLLNYDKAYYNGKLLPASLINEAFTPVKLNNGNNNPGNFGLGWEVSTDTTFGKAVYHNGNATGINCILIRNISQHQTIIIFDNIHYTNAQPLGFAALKILNGVQVSLPKKSLAAIYARVLLKDGAVAASDTVNSLKQDTLHYQLSEEELNYLGYDFMGGSNNPNPFRFPEEHKYQEAFETFKLNTELFPNSWNAYDSYGEILLKMGHKNEAVNMYKKSVELNPKNEGGKKVLEQLLK